MSLSGDWNELWKAARREASVAKKAGDKVKFWNRRACTYDSGSHRADFRVGQIQARLDITKDTSILDVGAGTGVLTIPLARLAGRVSAVDPSPGMLSGLKASARGEHLDNITCIERKWEDVIIGRDVEPHDLVVASFSLLMTDIRAALEKMDAAALKAVCLFWFVGREETGNEEIWQRLRGESYNAGPDYIYLVNVLYQMGIYPDVEINTGEFRHYYGSLDEAASDWQAKLSATSPEEVKIIRDYLAEILTAEGDRWYTSRLTKTALLWWHK